MSRLLVTFLGIGAPNQNPGYWEAHYTFNDTRSYTTRFSQSAIVQWLGPESFDRVLVLMTPQSKEKHWDLLKQELVQHGCRPDALIEYDQISVDQKPEHQWAWFRVLLDHIHDEDEVIFDFTHGFRSVPIVFSTAISFIQKVKRFRLLHAFYGYVADRETQQGEIIDMAPFYAINEWADGVSTFVETADVSKLALLGEAQRATLGAGFQAMGDPKLIDAMRDITEAIRDVDMNHVAQRTQQALTVITKHRKASSDPTDQILIDLILSKFSNLSDHAASDTYDASYFQLQLTLIRLLLDHDLNMQAFTVLRETVASIGMLGAPSKHRNKKRASSAGRSARRRFAEMFCAMAQFSEKEWKWRTTPEAKSEQEMTDFHALEPFWDKLKPIGVVPLLEEMVPEMFALRNGLNHGWTASGQAASVRKSGFEYLDQLTQIVAILEKHRLTL